MRKKNWVRCAFSVGLAFLLSTAGIACLVTTFDLEATIGTVLWWSMLWSVAFSVAYTLHWQLLPIGILALLEGYMLQSGRLYEAFGGLLYRLTGAYNQIHGWPILGQQANVDAALCALGILSAFSVSATVSGGKSCFWPVVCSAVPVVTSFFVSDTSPEPLWLGIWLFGMSLLLLTQPVRKRRDSKRLTALLAAPVAVLAVVLLVALPPKAQEKPRAFADAVTTFLEELGIGAAPGKSLKVDGGAVELNKLGSRKESTRPVMTVTADRDGTLYLRGCAYDTYFKNNWTNLALRDNMYWPDRTLLEPAGQVRIHTEYAMNMRYFPYYAPDTVTDSVNRGINNYGASQDYSYQLFVLTDRPVTNTCKPEDGFCQLPTVTKRWADGVLQELITPDMTDSQKLTAITAYVKACAKYSLYVDKMPASEQDFVVWFTQSAQRGYCVHFATTATLLLRAAGLPARYVTGYMVQARAGEAVQVYGKDAHAWVECFLEGVGWVPVEATPGAEPPSTQPAQQEEASQFSPLPLLYGSAGLVVLSLVGFVGQWLVRIWLRRRKRRKGDARTRFSQGYKQLSQLLALVNEKPSRQLEIMAERARFSPHPIPADGLKQLETAIKQAKKTLKRQPFLEKLHQRLILGLY